MTPYLYSDAPQEKAAGISIGVSIQKTLGILTRAHLPSEVAHPPAARRAHADDALYPGTSLRECLLPAHDARSQRV